MFCGGYMAATTAGQQRLIVWDYEVGLWKGHDAVLCAPSARAHRPERRSATVLTEFRRLASPQAGAAALHRFMQAHGGLALDFTDSGRALDRSPSTSRFLARPRPKVTRQRDREPFSVVLNIEQTGKTEADYIADHFAIVASPVERLGVPHLPAVYRRYAAGAEAILRVARAADGHAIKRYPEHRAALGHLQASFTDLPDRLAVQTSLQWWLAQGAVQISFEWPEAASPRIDIRADSLWAALGVELARQVTRTRGWDFCRRCDEFFTRGAPEGGRPSAYCPACLKSTTSAERQRMNEKVSRSRRA
jgi:hypothetical protein